MAKSTRAYPLPRVENDPRFNLGLLLAVAEVLEAKGFPKPDAYDFPDLSVALFRFLYRDEAAEAATKVPGEGR
jgi:hypothetical protein